MTTRSDKILSLFSLNEANAERQAQRALKLLREVEPTDDEKPQRPGRKQTAKTREILSKKMKAAHKNGIHPGWEARNGKTPDPESFFTRVIKDEFSDKGYEHDYLIRAGNENYWLDYAWVGKKKAIEIDGRQHDDSDRRKQDQRKDRRIRKLGWKILRISWSAMASDPKKWVQVAKDFIGK
jgi:very-short-patch-repair endonuclease